MKRILAGLLLACVTGASVFGLAYGVGISALFAREKAHTVDAHYGIFTLLQESAPEFDPGENAWLNGDPRRALIPVLTEEEYEKLNKHSTAYPIHPRYMTLGVSAEYCRLTPPEGYYDYADRLVIEAAVQSINDDSLQLTDCVFLGGKGEAMQESISPWLPEDLAETWSVGDRTEFSLRTWQQNGLWLYRVDKELTPKGGTKPEEVVSMAEDNLHGFDLVFTEDMGWIWRVMQGELRCVRGRLIGETDAGRPVCVVSERFLQENELALGDSISLRIGDKLCSQFAPIGAVAYAASQYPRRWTERTLEIVGIYEDADNGKWTADEFAYAYSDNTVFLPLSELPETVYRSSARYTPAELTLLPAGGDTLERKLGWMEEIVTPLGLRCVMDDRGWPDIAAGISTEEARLRARSLAFILSGAVLFVLLFAGLLLTAIRRCTVLRLAGVPKRRLISRSLIPSLVPLWSAAAAGTAGALLYLGTEAAGFREKWSAFMPVSEQGPPTGTMVLIPGLACFVLSGGLVLLILLLLGQDLHVLADRLQRKAGKG